MLRIPIAAFIVMLLLSSCKQNSRLARFQYLGYGDDVQATLYGNVARLQGAGDTSPLAQARVMVLETGATTTTASDGAFELHLPEGAFSLLVTKERYQELVLRNYVAHEDQVSVATVILAEGAGRTATTIPSPNSQ